VLDLERVPTFVRKPVATLVPKHVRVNGKIETGSDARSLDATLKSGPRHRRTALADEYRASDVSRPVRCGADGVAHLHHFPDDTDSAP
jgi:hypothetical protein